MINRHSASFILLAVSSACGVPADKQTSTTQQVSALVEAGAPMHSVKQAATNDLSRSSRIALAIARDPQPDGILFETDFSADSGYRVQSVNLWNGGGNGPVQPPRGWDAVKATGRSVISVVPGEGISGKNALKIEWDAQLSQPTVSLVKHLSGTTASGHDELYIRYHVKLPDNFKAGSDAKYIPYWKWGRLWQNTSPTGKPRANSLTENRPNSGYVVWGFGGASPYTMMSAVWSENSGPNLGKGSAGGERQGVDYFVSGANASLQDGYFESMGDGDWKFDRRNPGFLASRNQSYHTVEFRFKLATSDDAEDGVFEMWWDGKKQSRWTRLGAGSGPSVPQRRGIPTIRRGSGFNLFTMFDNMTGWNRDWGHAGVDGYILVNDVVVSKQRIGHEYVVTGG